MNEPLQGNFEGIGIQFNMAEDTLLVIQPVSGGPSEKVGILAGDRIVMVEDTLIWCKDEHRILCVVSVVQKIQSESENTSPRVKELLPLR